MSYILDALRKADAERDRGNVPGIHAQPSFGGAMPTRAPADAKPWLWLAAGALAVLIVVALAWYLMSPSPTAAVATPITTAPVLAAPAPVTPAPVAAPPVKAAAPKPDAAPIVRKPRPAPPPPRPRHDGRCREARRDRREGLHARRAARRHPPLAAERRGRRLDVFAEAR